MAVIDLHINDETSGPALAPAVGDEHRADALDFRPDLAGWLAARSAQRDRMRRPAVIERDERTGGAADRVLTVVQPLRPAGGQGERRAARPGTDVLAPVVPIRPSSVDDEADVDENPVTAAPTLTLVPSRPRYGVRRAAALVLALVVGATAWSVAGWLEGSPVVVDRVGADLTDDARPTITVEPGDTLWSIAASLDPDGDIRAVVDRLAELNGGSSLTVGQRLVLPG